MKLSQNFTLEEFTNAGHGKLIGKDEQFQLSDEFITNAKNLCVHLVQPIRDYINVRYGTGVGLKDIPLHVISGYRSKFVNDHVHGSKTSYHLRAMAMDLKCLVNGRLHNDYILEAVNVMQLPFTELIREFGTEKNPLIMHVALDVNHVTHTRKRGLKRNGKTVYFKD